MPGNNTTHNILKALHCNTGNISLMITDLAKIGEINKDRKKGMQAMLYQYDQLHRIMQSRSLTSYSDVTGFAPRSGAGAYDEDYTYDANGNILTLMRNNEAAAVMDDFNYKYYLGTNRLREVKPVNKDKVYSSGPVRTDNIVYRNVTLTGNAYVPSGETVEVKALENIDGYPDFESEEGTDFWAHIMSDEGTYQYDAIGNLILDQDEGVQIEWTPYGKVRAVRTKGDSILVSFRYDGSGNRVEKRVVKRDTVENISVTRYLRDASGNVMTIYKDTTVLEQPIYGSARLGMKVQEGREGYQIVGLRNYELSNHLGNVLAVISDNIKMHNDSVWTNALSARDYYPFGLDMELRTWSDTTSTYRYGFNGKEKNDKGVFGSATYDYGFRIYNPSIAKFLSVDPLSSSFSWYSPYLVAGNSPVKFIDEQGLFKIDPLFAKRYPTLAKMIRHYLPMLKDNPEIIKAWTETTGRTESEFIDMVTYGKGPYITVSRDMSELKDPLNRRLAKFFENESYPLDGGEMIRGYPNNIRIDKDDVENMERIVNLGGKEASSLQIFMVNFIIMHEAAHWGNSDTEKPATDYANETGARFEERAFGIRFSYTNPRSSDFTKQGLDRGKLMNYFINNRNSTTLFGLTITPDYSGYWNTIEGAPAPDGQEGDPTVQQNDYAGSH